MNNIPESYELLKTESLTDIHSTGSILRHSKTGARVVCIENDDENKVFYIGFRTPVYNSTGVPHIIEHSVLCGSDKYQLKDPFVELAKGSMNTFLNAITYPDKTVYPIASTNDKDFKNLMDVYLDAVFHPNIYHHEEIFKQEGWHYELKDKDDELKINGVVYNEMKGAFSSPDDLMDRAIYTSLFPNTTYHYESGGDPKDIPTLSYQTFLNFHRKFYHPSNSYIYLYGNMDMFERLSYIDKAYLSKYDEKKVDSEVLTQNPFTGEKVMVKEYPVSSDESTERKTYLSYNKVVGNTLNPETYYAFQVLDQVLLNAPGAPIRKALEEAGIADEVLGGYDSTLKQPIFSVQLKGSDEKYMWRFTKIVNHVLEDLAENGLDKKALLGTINVMQFRFREADFGNFPKGLIYGLDMLESWLYDDDKPFSNLYGIKVLNTLKGRINSGYFEELIWKYFLENTHGSIVVIKPHPGLQTERDNELKASLQNKKDSFSDEEIQKIIDDTKALREYQETPETEEALESLPMLSRSDLRRNIKPFKNKEYDIDGIKFIHHDIFTNGINYFDALYDITDFDPDEYSAISLFSKCLGLVDTQERSYADFSKDVFLYTGGINSDVKTQTVKQDGTYKVFFSVSSKYLYEYSEKVEKLVEELILKPDFSDEGRLLDLVKQEASSMQERLVSAGHNSAVLRADSYFSEKSYVNDLLNGIGYYEFLKSIIKDSDKKIPEIKKMFEGFVKEIFRQDNLLVSSTGEEIVVSSMKKSLPVFKTKLSDAKHTPSKKKIKLTQKNEGIKTASQVQFVCRAGNFKDKGFAFNGSMEILRTILSYEYFWQNLRVQGGAYGCMSNFTRDGNISFVSYRDPHLKRTNEVFEKTVDYLKNFDISDRDMTKYIIGTIGMIDVPKTPAQEGQRCLRHYLSDVTDEEVQKTRDQILDATQDDIKALAAPVKAIIDQNNICVIGNEEKVESEKELFKNVESLS
jgi:Zn-dependent M16 (insulinase) family peptidase